MSADETRYMLALTRVPRLTPTLRCLLLNTLGSATEVFVNRRNLKDAIPDISDKLCNTIASMEEYLKQTDEELDFIHQKGIQCLCYGQENYPTRLNECSDAPSVLYYLGNAELNRSHVINIVGTRHCTEYGKDFCKNFLTELKQLCPQVLVISGLAYGIDIAAHRAALERQLDTVGVLAHGLDQIYPRIHRDTAIRMVHQGGLITEFMSGTPAEKVNFIRRNRIVAGLSDATIVVESGEKGGSLITADIAESYHRDVFALPGRNTDAASVGCNNLIKDCKATLLQNAKEFVMAMGWITAEEAQRRQQQPIQRHLFPELTEEEQLIVHCLQNCDSKQINRIVVETNLPIHRVNTLLFYLEMKGVVKLLNGGMYRLVT